MFRFLWTPTSTPEPASGASSPASDIPESAAHTVQHYLSDVDEAARLAATDTTHLSARTNPRVLAHQMRSQDGLHQELIDLEDDRAQLAARREHARQRDQVESEDRWARARVAREERAIRESTADADEAAADLSAVRGWQREESPASAARHLARLRTTRSREFLVFAAVASGVSALGIAALAHHTVAWTTWWSAGAIGAAVEVILTLLVTRIIALQASLDAHDKSKPKQTQSDNEEESEQAGRPPEGRADGYPWVVVIVLVAASIVLNTLGVIVGTGLLGAVGVIAAFVAALCAGLAWHTASAASQIIAANVATFHTHHWQQHRAELAQRAAGTHIPATETPSPHTPTEKEPTQDHTHALAQHTAQIVIEHLRRQLPAGPARIDLGQAFSPQDQQFLTGLDEQFHTADAGPSSGGSVALAEPNGPGDAARPDAGDALPHPGQCDAAEPEVSSSDAADAAGNTRPGSASAAHNNQPDDPADPSDAADGDAVGDAPPDAGSDAALQGLTVAQVRAYFRHHPEASRRQAARDLAVSEATIRRRLNGITHP